MLMKNRWGVKALDAGEDMENIEAGDCVEGGDVARGDPGGRGVGRPVGPHGAGGERGKVDEVGLGSGMEKSGWSCWLNTVGEVVWRLGRAEVEEIALVFAW